MGEAFDPFVEALRMRLERFEGFEMAEPKATGHILNPNSKDSTPPGIQDAAKQSSHPGISASPPGT